MAVPKRKHSKSRRDKKKANKGTKAPNLVKCSQCGQMKRPHHICSNCGYYKDKQIIENKK